MTEATIARGEVLGLVGSPARGKSVISLAITAASPRPKRREVDSSDGVTAQDLLALTPGNAKSARVQNFDDLQEPMTALNEMMPSASRSQRGRSQRRLESRGVEPSVASREAAIAVRCRSATIRISFRGNAPAVFHGNRELARTPIADEPTTTDVLFRRRFSICYLSAPEIRPAAHISTILR